MGSRPGSARAGLDLLRAQRQGAPGLARRQEARFAALVRHARVKSRYYERLYRGLPTDAGVLGDLPPVTKPELMGSFDGWVTDPAVTRAGAEAFIADPARIGERYLGRYFACTTSGTTGLPGVFVHDPGECAVYQALTYRVGLAWLSGPQWLAWLACGIAGRRWSGPGAISRPQGGWSISAANGQMVSVLPLAIGSILDQTSGVHRSQLVQTGPASLLLRLDLEPGMPGGQAWDHACSNLTRFLAAHGLAGIDITRAAERPQTSATSGKFRRIIARAPGSRPMTELVTDGDLDARTAIQALTSPATQIGLVSEDRPRAVVATIRSGFHRAGGA